MFSTFGFSLLGLSAFLSGLVDSHGFESRHSHLPSVVLPYGTYIGAHDASTTQFLGIPFARPPVGNLRFQRPQAPLPKIGFHNATTLGAACHQQPLSAPPDLHIEKPYNAVSEDCLTINVIKPSSFRAQHDKLLPIMFWIHGGGFEIGHALDGPLHILVERSAAIGQPIMLVSANYRLGAFGFLGGKEVKAHGVSNLGLHDQNLALEWVQKYIRRFGGDPHNVVIGGASAGAISVGTQILAHGRDHIKSLPFRGAFMQCGSTSSTTAVEKGQDGFDQITRKTSCSGARDRLDCLRKVPFERLVAAANTTRNVFSYSSLGNEWRPRVDGDLIKTNPICAIVRGRFAKVPILVGGNDDEGTIFSFSSLNVTTNKQFLDYIQQFYLYEANEGEMNLIAQQYPEDPSAGSPFGTGGANALTPQFKRLAAIQGDIVFQTARRFFTEAAAKTQDTWAFFNERSKNKAPIGSAHCSDTPIWFPPANSTDFRGTDALVRFVNTLDPNLPQQNSSAGFVWPKYGSDKSLLTFVDSSTEPVITVDDFRASPLSLSRDILVKLAVQDGTC